MENAYYSCLVSDVKTVQWGFQDDRFNKPTGLFVDVLHHQWPDGRPRGVCSDRIRYQQNLSKDQRKHIEVRELSSLRKSGLRPLDGIHHRDSILRAEGVTVEMQEDAEDIQDCIDSDTPSARKEMEEFTKTPEAQALIAKILDLPSE